MLQQLDPLDHWRNLPIKQQPQWRDADAVAAVSAEIATLPPLVFAGEVDIRFGLRKRKQATWPVTELHDRWVPHATATDYAEALQLVSEEAAKLLVDEHDFSIEDAFIFLSVACDAGVALPVVRIDWAASAFCAARTARRALMSSSEGV